MGSKKIFRSCLLFMALCVPLLACSPVRPDRTTLVGHELQWPALPMEPKIRWVQEIRNYQDVGLQQGFWKRVWGFIAGESRTDIVKPYGIFCDEAQRLFVVDVGAGIIHLFDIGAGRYSTIEEKEGGGFKTPIGITGDGKGNVYITDAGGGMVYLYDVAKGHLKRFTPFKLQRPTGIAYNKANGLLYVSDTATHQVIALDSAGKEQFRFGGRGVEKGQFNFPTDLVVEASGKVLVTDALNSRIQIFSPEGTPLASFGKAGDTPGTFAKPKGVAVDSDGHIYVNDALFDAVQIFDQNGSLLLGFGESGERPGQFWMPSGLYIDSTDTIYVADTYNRRVQVFKYLK